MTDIDYCHNAFFYYLIHNDTGGFYFVQKIAILGMALMLGLSSSTAAFADQAETSATTMENCGAYLFEWRPVDCGDGHYFAILVGGNTINESNVILNRGYDYPYTFDYTVPRPWGEVPQLVNIDGVWGIPENWGILPEGSQPTLRITLITNNKILPTKERYIDVVSLPQNINSRDLPAEVRKYLINVDGSDAGAYDGTTTAGWEEENGLWRYRKSDNTYVSNTWLKLDDKQYYMNEQGIMLADTITPDGYYVNAKGEKTGYKPGWLQDGASWKYVRKTDIMQPINGFRTRMESGTILTWRLSCWRIPPLRTAITWMPAAYGMASQPLLS